MNKHFRLDIQALRALAVLYAVGFHLWPNHIPGGFAGVDIFFVISGFLITSQLVEQFNNGTFKIRVFWGRRIRRLLPAALTVLIATGTASYFILKDTDKLTVFPEITASTFYFENWTLARNAVDYLGQDNAISPVQHYWSLSVEEQFYIGLPILLVLVFLLSRILKNYAFKKLVKYLLVLLFLSSLSYSIFLSSIDPKVSFFSTLTRVWEFALGALVIFLPKITSFSNRVRSSLILIATIGLVACAFLLNNSLPYPSFFALLPALSAILFIWVGVSNGWFAKLLQTRPIQHLGDISYSVYLWHWPLVVLVPEYTRTELNSLQKISILVATFVLATSSRKYIEKPVILWGQGRNKADAKTFLAALLISVLIAGGSSLVVAESRTKIDLAFSNVQSLGLQKCFGAQARLEDGSICSNEKITQELNPPLEIVADDKPARLYPKCDMPNREEFVPKVCRLGDRAGTIRVILSGDSHANHFMQMADNLGKANGWQVDALAKGGCPLNYLQRVHDLELTESCTKWVENAVEFIKRGKYDILITSSASGTEYRSDNASYPDPVSGFVDLWKEIVESGTAILVIKDNPKPVSKVASCIAQNLDTYLISCSVDRTEAFDYDPLVPAVSAVNSPMVKLLNLDNVYCGKTICEPVIGKVIVYRDDNHLTSTFANSLQNTAAEAITFLLRERLSR